LNSGVCLLRFAAIFYAPF